MKTTISKGKSKRDSTGTTLQSEQSKVDVAQAAEPKIGVILYDPTDTIIEALEDRKNITITKRKTSRSAKIVVKSGKEQIAKIIAKRVTRGILVDELSVSDEYKARGIGKALLASAVNTLRKSDTKNISFGTKVGKDTADRLGSHAESAWGLRKK